MWANFFRQSDVRHELLKIKAFLETEMFSPRPDEIFKAFSLTPPDKVKVVILGQDPYHGVNPDGTMQAMGLAFSVRSGTTIPSSLRNIFKEAGVERPSGDLTHWANQGVFLLNTALTVRLHSPDSHTKIWAKFTELLVKFLAALPNKPIFVLWGAKANKFAPSLRANACQVLSAPHPSGLSAHTGFFGCGHFKILNELSEPEIRW